MTLHAGLALAGDFAVGQGSMDSVDRYLSQPGNGAGHNPSLSFFLLRTTYERDQDHINNRSRSYYRKFTLKENKCYEKY